MPANFSIDEPHYSNGYVCTILMIEEEQKEGAREEVKNSTLDTKR